MLISCDSIFLRFQFEKKMNWNTYNISELMCNLVGAVIRPHFFLNIFYTWAEWTKFSFSHIYQLIFQRLLDM